MKHLIPQHRLSLWQMGPDWLNSLSPFNQYALLSTSFSFVLSPWTFHDLKAPLNYRVCDSKGRELYSVWDNSYLGVNSLDQILILQSRHGDLYRMVINRPGKSESGCLIINRLTPRFELELRGDIQPRRRSAIHFTGVNRAGYFLAAPLLPVPTVSMIRNLGMRFDEYYWPEQSGWFAPEVGSFGTPAGEGSDRWMSLGDRAFLIMGNEINADVIHRVFQQRIDLDGFSQTAVVQMEVQIQ